MPLWLAEYLLLNQSPPMPPPVKVSFVLVPWNKDQDAEPLPELLNTYALSCLFPTSRFEFISSLQTTVEANGQSNFTYSQNTVSCKGFRT